MDESFAKIEPSWILRGIYDLTMTLSGLEIGILPKLWLALYETNISENISGTASSTGELFNNSIRGYSQVSRELG